MTNNDRLTRLLEKYRNNTLSAEEYREFLELSGDPAASGILDRMLEEDWRESKSILLRSQPDRPLMKERKLPVKAILWGSVASVVLLIGIFFLMPDRRPSEPVAYETAYGETRTILLPDSSTVLLNANSRLVWDDGWKKNGRRDVRLDGEAFFDVKKTDGMEFVVQSNHIRVKVLGTSFNVLSRNGLSQVFLETGKVDLEIPELREHPVTMTPGNVVRYDAEKNNLRIDASSSLHKSASWVEGMLAFENTALGDILDHLEGLYGKTFVAKDGIILEKRMDLSLPYSNWELIRKAIELSADVKFTENQDTIIVH